MHREVINTFGNYNIITSNNLKWINQIKTTQQESSNITQNNQHSSYQLKPPYYSMQATYLPQFNNPPQPHRERERERERTLIISPTSLTLLAISCIYARSMVQMLQSVNNRIWLAILEGRVSQICKIIHFIYWVTTNYSIKVWTSNIVFWKWSEHCVKKGIFVMVHHVNNELW